MSTHTRSIIITSTPSVTPDVDRYDLIDITEQAEALTINNPSGSRLANGDYLVFRIKDDGTSQGIEWGDDFREVAAALPDTTVAGEILYISFSWNETEGKWDSIGGNVSSASEYLMVSCSDLVSVLAVADPVGYFRMPFAMTLTGVKASVLVAPTGSTLIITIKKNGVTVLSTNLTIDAGEKTSATAAVPAVISDSSLALDDEITIAVTQVGSTIAGKGLIVSLLGTR